SLARSRGTKPRPRRSARRALLLEPNRPRTRRAFQTRAFKSQVSRDRAAREMYFSGSMTRHRTLQLTLGPSRASPRPPSLGTRCGAVTTMSASCTHRDGLPKARSAREEVHRTARSRLPLVAVTSFVVATGCSFSYPSETDPACHHDVEVTRTCE